MYLGACECVLGPGQVKRERRSNACGTPIFHVPKNFLPTKPIQKQVVCLKRDCIRIAIVSFPASSSSFRPFLLLGLERPRSPSLLLIVNLLARLRAAAFLTHLSSSESMARSPAFFLSCRYLSLSLPPFSFSLTYFFAFTSLFNALAFSSGASLSPLAFCFSLSLPLFWYVVRRLTSCAYICVCPCPCTAATAGTAACDAIMVWWRW